MLKNGPFTEQLLVELKRWLDLGIITSAQKIRIESLYTAQTTEPDKPAAPVSRPAERINIARVIIGLATLCLAVGIVIFYASNWRKMPPSLKLVQVFFLIASTYGAAWWFLQEKRRFSILGDALLLLGMICYGAGIMLVAQVYHISSHPTNGLMAWAAGTFAMAALMRSRYGLYLAMLLFTVWDIWEYSYFGNDGFLYGIPVILFAILFYRAKDSIGMKITSLLFSLYFLQVSFYLINHMPSKGVTVYVLTAALITAGSLMRFAGKKLTLIVEPATSGRIIFVTGWIAWMLPLYQINRLQPDIQLPLLVWGCSTLIAPVVMRERSGYYVSSALFFIWSLSTKSTPYGYIIPVLILSVLFYIIRDRNGIAISAISTVYYYYVATIGLIPSGTGYETTTFLVIILHFPLAAALITAGRLVSASEILGSGGRIFTIAGWLSLLVPFTAISWPLDMGKLPYIATFTQYSAQGAEYLLLMFISFAGLYLLRNRDESIKIILPAVILPAAMFLLPLNHTTTRMISLHIAALVFMYILLYYTHTDHEKKSFERRYAFIFTVWLIIIKCIGFLSYSSVEESFKLAYLTGFILFATVCFLINRFVDETLSTESIDYPGGAIDALCAAGVWITIYIASFRIDSQNSIFRADAIVLKMTLLFISIAAALYYVLYRKIQSERIMLNLSLVIFLSAGITMFAAGPWIPWELYSVIFNILLFITSAVFMYYSSVMQSKRILNFATAGIVLQVFTRYFDLFWDMFSGAMLFIITGILGLAGGYILEKKRKRLTEMIETSTIQSSGTKGGKI